MTKLSAREIDGRLIDVRRALKRWNPDNEMERAQISATIGVLEALLRDAPPSKRQKIEALLNRCRTKTDKS